MALSEWFSEKWDQATRRFRRTQRKRRRQAELSLRRARVKMRARQRRGLPPEEPDRTEQAPEPERRDDHHFAPPPEEIPAAPPEEQQPEGQRRRWFKEIDEEEVRNPTPEELREGRTLRWEGEPGESPQGQGQDRESNRLLTQINETLGEIRDIQEATQGTLAEISDKLPQAVYGP